MSRLSAERLSTERLRLLETEATLQRAALSATFAKLEQRRALAWGEKAATWGFRLLSQPKIRWLIASGILARLKRRWAR
jgi:hypothetical protein